MITSNSAAPEAGKVGSYLVNVHGPVSHTVRLASGTLVIVPTSLIEKVE